MQAGDSISLLPHEAIGGLKRFEVSVGSNIKRMLRRLVGVLPEAGNPEFRPLAIGRE